MFSEFKMGFDGFFFFDFMHFLDMVGRLVLRFK